MNLWKIEVDDESGKAIGKPSAIPLPTSDCRAFSVSRDGRKIAYISREENTVFFKVSVDLNSDRIIGKPAEIGKISGSVVYEDISPDGRWVSFSTDGRPSILYALRTDGGELKKLTSDSWGDRGAKWMEDSRQLVFYSMRKDTMPNVWTMNIDGSNLTQLTNGVPDAYEPAQSPDGRILSINFPGGGVGTRFVDLSVPLAQRTAQQMPAIDSEKTIFRSRYWSPDGKFMAGLGEKSNRRIAGLFIYSVKDRKYFEIRPDYKSRPMISRWVFGHWLGDSRTLVFQVDQDIYVTDIITKKVRVVCNTAQLSTELCLLVGVSRNGNALFFKRTDVHENLWLATIHLKDD